MKKYRENTLTCIVPGINEGSDAKIFYLTNKFVAKECRFAYSQSDDENLLIK